MSRALLFETVLQRAAIIFISLAPIIKCHKIHRYSFSRMTVRNYSFVISNIDADYCFRSERKICALIRLMHQCMFAIFIISFSITYRVLGNEMHGLCQDFILIVCAFNRIFMQVFMRQHMVSYVMFVFLERIEMYKYIDGKVV